MTSTALTGRHEKFIVDYATCDNAAGAARWAAQLPSMPKYHKCIANGSFPSLSTCREGPFPFSSSGSNGQLAAVPPALTLKQSP
jgi:hypothetical protein